MPSYQLFTTNNTWNMNNGRPCTLSDWGFSSIDIDCSRWFWPVNDIDSLGSISDGAAVVLNFIS